MHPVLGGLGVGHPLEAEDQWGRREDDELVVVLCLLDAQRHGPPGGSAWGFAQSIVLISDETRMLPTVRRITDNGRNPGAFRSFVHTGRPFRPT